VLLDFGEVMTEGEASGFVPLFVDPAAELLLTAFDPVEVFVLAPLFDPVDELALPGLDLVFELAEESALSRAEEFLLLL
jgi:hypothetical protein